MPYVMVPVPEDRVEEVMQFMLRRSAQAEIEPWTTETVATVFGEVDEPSRSLLSVIARATLTSREVTDTEAADMIELSRREVVGIMRELNDRAREGGHPGLLNARLVSESLPNGRIREKRVLWMPNDVAEMVRDAEHAELREQHPQEQAAP